MAYQIFISYRRSTPDKWVIDTIKDRLVSEGYEVFFDMESIGGEKYNEKIRSALDEISDFLVFIAPGTFDNCIMNPTDPDDYMRREIDYAIEKGKHIIPVMWKGCENARRYGEGLPENIVSLFEYNGISDANSAERICFNMKRLISFIHAEPKRAYSDTVEIKEIDGTEHNPMTVAEKKRLHLQEKYSRELDDINLATAKKLMGKSDNLTALDIGCADGYVTKRRLNKENGFTATIGIDRSEKAINSANKNAGDDIFSFYCLDVESADFSTRLEAILNLSEIKSFDVIYSAFTLHHLKDPIKLLKTVKKHLSPNGVVILRGVDDGAQISYACSKSGKPDSKRCSLIDENLRLSVSTPGMSNRFHGRQFYSWLKLSGFNNIKINYSIIDTVDKEDEELLDLYEYYFSFRADYTERQLLNNENNQEYIVHNQKMLSNLQHIKKMMTDDELFYYMVMSFGAVGLNN